MTILDLPSVLISLILSLVVLIPIFCRHGRRLPPSPFGLPIIGHFHLLGPLLHRSFYDLSRRWGPLFSLRLGSVPCVVISSPDLAREILKTNELCFSTRTETIAAKRLTYGSAMAFAPYDTYWKFIRKLTMHELLGSRPVSSFAELRSRELRRVLGILAEKSERREATNLSAELGKLSYSVILQMLLGINDDSSAAANTSVVDRSRMEEARKVVRDVTRIFGEFNVSDFVWILKSFDLQGFEKRIEDIFRRYDALIEAVLGEREELRRKRKEEGKEGAKDRDFLDILLDRLEDQKDDNVEFTRLHIKGFIIDIFTAGTDTTASSTEYAIAELINNPTILEKAREEIDRVVGKSRLVNESDGPNLPYIQAIVKETLRLHPPVPLVTRECVKECKVGDYVIPVDAMLVVNNWAISRDPRYWESPLDFKPERFLAGHVSGEGSHNSRDVKGQHFEVLPFGSGRRMCSGMNLALQQVPIFIAAIIQCFDLKVVGPQGDGKDVPVLNMDEGPGLATPRLHELVCVPVQRICPLNAILETQSLERS